MKKKMLIMLLIVLLILIIIIVFFKFYKNEFNQRNEDLEDIEVTSQEFYGIDEENTIASFKIDSGALDSLSPNPITSEYINIYEIGSKEYKIVNNSDTSAGCFGEQKNDTNEYLVTSKDEFEKLFEEYLNNRKIDDSMEKGKLSSYSIEIYSIRYKDEELNTFEDLESKLFD